MTATTITTRTSDLLNALSNDIQIIENGGRDIETHELLTSKEMAQLGASMTLTLQELWGRLEAGAV